jgi:putative acetyltransferase
MTGGLVVAPADPLAPDVLELLRAHLRFVAGESPPEDVHALQPEALAAPGTTFVAAHRHGRLVGVGALQALEPGHGELKSMHTAASDRGSGVARAVLAHLIGLAHERGLRRLSLETGTTDAFAPARRLYAAAGFVPCGPFGAYRESPWSTFFTSAVLTGAASTRAV